MKSHLNEGAFYFRNKKWFGSRRFGIINEQKVESIRQ